MRQLLFFLFMDSFVFKQQVLFRVDFLSVTLDHRVQCPVVQLDVNSRVQHPVALFLHPVALFVSCYAPCPFCLAVPFMINVVLHQHVHYLNTVLKLKCHGQS